MFVLVSFLCERFSAGWNTQQALLFLFPDAVFKSRSWKKLYVSCHHICWWMMEMTPWVLISYWWLEDGMWCLLGTGRRGKGFTVTLTNAAPILHHPQALQCHQSGWAAGFAVWHEHGSPPTSLHSNCNVLRIFSLYSVLHISMSLVMLGNTC